MINNTICNRRDMNEFPAHNPMWWRRGALRMFCLGVTALLAAVLALAPVQAAEVATGTITGTIVDTQQQPIGGARVILVEFDRTVTAADNGTFTFDHVPVGVFHIEGISRRVGSGVAEVAVTGQGTVDVIVVLQIETHREAVVVTGSARGRGTAESYTPTTSLDRTVLQQKVQPTLGETLARESGVQSTGFAPGSSRPVIRGQSAGRIRILEGGVGVGDASTTSPDHAVASDPFSAERIEVVRGAGTLLYGSTAVGGVVNILDERVPTYMPQERLGGELNLIGGSVSDERTASLILGGGAGQFAWHVDALTRETADFDIPGQGIAGDPDSPVGTLPNSSLDSESYTFGGSWVGDNGFVGVSFRGYDTNYGIPAELEGDVFDPNNPVVEEQGGVAIDLERRRVDLRGRFNTTYGLFDGVRFNVGITEYEHTELEGSEVGTVFQNDFYEGRVELPHSAGEKLNGVIGAQFLNRDFQAIGDEAFVPPSETGSLALFALQEIELGSVSFEGGLRFETTDLEAEGNDSRDFTGVSASVGSLWRFADDWVLGGNISRTERAPGAEELYSDGAHLATLSFEIGDPTLQEEIALGADLFLRKRAGRVTGSVSLFLIDYSDYIFESPTGQVQDDLPVFLYSQADAEFTGGELQVLIELYNKDGNDFDLELLADWVEAELDSGGNLPFIPAMRYGARLHYRGPHWHALAGAIHYADQDDTASFETATAGYTLLEASVGYRFKPVGGTLHELLVRGTNLSDRIARNHISRLKDYVPLAGRDVSLVYRLIF